MRKFMVDVEYSCW